MKVRRPACTPAAVRSRSHANAASHLPSSTANGRHSPLVTPHSSIVPASASSAVVAPATRCSRAPEHWMTRCQQGLDLQPAACYNTVEQVSLAGRRLASAGWSPQRPDPAWSTPWATTWEGDQPIRGEGAKHELSNVNNLHSAGPAVDGTAASDYEGRPCGGPHRGAHASDAGRGGAGPTGGRARRPDARAAGAAAARARRGVRRTWRRTTVVAGRGPMAGEVCCRRHWCLP